MLFNVQSVYTMLSSTLQISDYVKFAKAQGYQALGLADNQVLHASYAFYHACQEAGLKPLLGMKLEFPGLIDSNRKYSFLLYTKNYQGYLNLIHLSKEVSDHEVDYSALYQYIETNKDNLVVISLSKLGELDYAIIHNASNQVDILEAWRKLIGENFYLSLPAFPYNLIENKMIIDFAHQHQIKIVSGQQVESLSAADGGSLEVLKAIKDNRLIDRNNLQFKGASYLYTYSDLIDQYRALGLEEVIRHSQDLIKELNLVLPDKQNLLPVYKSSESKDSNHLLSLACHQALKNLQDGNKKDYEDRLAYELKVIAEMGFSDYFLIVADIIAYCRQAGIRIGPGRGSAAGSLVSYLLQITSVDPIQWGLLFERFLNPERHSMPDIDIDVPDNKRDQVISYVQDKYGHKNVAQIITFGSFGAKQSIRDTLRVLDYSSEEMKEWSRYIPTDPNQTMTLDRAYQESIPFRKLVDRSNSNQAIFQMAQKIEGLPRHSSTHAAAVVINDFPLEDVIPVMAKPEGGLITQFAMQEVEAVGLLKMDFLGLRNLAILDQVLDRIEASQKIKLDIDLIPLDDLKTLDLFAKADTNGVFQFESRGIKQVLKKLHPESFEDIVAVIALYRPGPMKQIDNFIDRKQGRQTISYLDPILQPILKNTYGIIVYQEQVMQIVRAMAGYSFGEADILRRAMGKKDQALMDQERQHFVQAAIEQGYEENLAQAMFAYINEFAKYGFNRSHAVVYSLLAYQLAYLKSHYPAEFYASVLSSGSSQNVSTLMYIKEAKLKLGGLIAPDINASLMDFQVQANRLQVGLGQIKGLRKDFINFILNDRDQLGPYKSIEDFLHRMDQRFLKVDTILPLILVGAFDHLGYNRATLHDNLEALIQNRLYTGQSMSLFKELEPKIINKAEFDKDRLLAYEKEYLGFSLEDHPLNKYQSYIESHTSYYDLGEIGSCKLKSRIKTIAMIESLRVIRTKSQALMAFVNLSNDIDQLNMVCFPDTYLRYKAYLKEGQLIHLVGTYDLDNRGQAQIILQEVYDLPDLSQVGSEIKIPTCFIKISDFQDEVTFIEAIKQMALEFPGPSPIILVDQNKQAIQLNPPYQISFSNHLRQTLKVAFPERQIVFKTL